MAMARVSSTPAQLTVVVADVFPSMPASQFSAPGEFPDKIHHHATPFAIVNSREAFKKLPAATLAHLLDPANIKAGARRCTGVPCYFWFRYLLQGLEDFSTGEDSGGRHNAIQ